CTLGFGAPPSTAYFNSCPLPTTLSGGPHILPFWDDLITGPLGICASVSGTSPMQRYTITWDGATHFGDATTLLHFSVVLHEEDGTFDLVYGSMTGTYGDAHDASVGVESSSLGASTTLSCDMAGSVLSGSAFHVAPM